MQGRARGENATMNTPLKQRNTSLFDLSFDHKLSFNMGELIPFFCKETLPGDHWQLSTSTLLRFAKLYLPVMHRVEVHQAWFYVSNDILYDRWKSFIKPVFGQQQAQILPNDAETQGFPVQELTPHPVFNFTLSGSSGLVVEFWKDSLPAYMGFPTPTEEPPADVAIQFSALPIAAYWKIWNDFYRRPQTQFEFGRDAYNSELPILRDLPVSGVSNALMTDHYTEWITINGTSDGYGTSVGFLKPVKRNWNPDYFTMATFEPQYGEDVIIPVFTTERGLDLANATRAWSISTGELQDSAGSVSVHTTGNLRSTGNPTPQEIALDVSGTAGTLQELRYAESMQQFLERLNRVGDRYRDYIRGFWGVDPSPYADDYTVYIGSVTDNVMVSDVMSYSDARPSTPSGVSDGLGSYAGKMLSANQSKVFNFHAREHGFIIGIINVQPRSSYSNGMHRMWSRLSWEDYANDEFAHIGDQEIQKRELVLNYSVPSDDPSQLETWAYVPRYQEMRYSQDIISGELRKEWTGFHFGRIFDQLSEPPVLNGDFLNCEPDEARIFELIDPSGTNPTHTIYGQIWCHAQVIRQLPKYGVPAL